MLYGITNSKSSRCLHSNVVLWCPVNTTIRQRYCLYCLTTGCCLFINGTTMSKQSTSNIPTCATYDQYVESQLMREFIANNLLSAENQQDVLVSRPFSQRAVDTTIRSNNEMSRIGSTIVIPAAATHSNMTKRYYTKKLRTMKYVKRLTSIGMWSQNIKKLKNEILLLEEMEMILYEQMQDLQEDASRKSYEDVVCG